MSLRAVAYNDREVKEIPLEAAGDYPEHRIWVSLLAPEPGEIERVAAAYGLHPLVTDDLQHEGELPKAQDYARYTFIVLDVPGHCEDFCIHKMYMAIGEKFLITQTRSWDVIRAVDAMLFSRSKPLTEGGPDFLAYTLIDRAVDHFYPVLDEAEDIVSDIEDKVVETPDRRIMEELLDARRYLLKIRKSAWLDREVLSTLERGQSPYFKASTIIYLRDVYDHIVQIMDLVETYRDILAASRDTYMSSISNSLNEVMKQLTIIATIMLPLTFIASLYGMNFKYMPGLDWPYSFDVLLAVMIALTLLMIAYFIKKRWV
jgi:magnesium transporter